MTAHLDILDRADSLRAPFLQSMLLHGAVISAAVAYAYIGSSPHMIMGDPDALRGGGSVAISPVSRIPLPDQGGPENPLAADTDSTVPTPPKEAEVKTVKPPEDPNAFALKGRQKKDKQTKQAYYRPPGADAPNQIYSSQQQALSSRMFGTTTTGSGEIGMGGGNPFGNRFGYYVSLVREKVGRNWSTEGVSAAVQNAPAVIVTFQIQKDGSVKNITMVQRSGNLVLDQSCLKAVEAAAPFEALPAGFEKSSAQFEFWFQLSR